MDNKDHFGKSPVAKAADTLDFEDLLAEVAAVDPGLYWFLKPGFKVSEIDYSKLESKLLSHHINAAKIDLDKSKPLPPHSLVYYDTETYKPIDFKQQIMQLPNTTYTGEPDNMPHELGTDENDKYKNFNKSLTAFDATKNLCNTQPWPIKGRLGVDCSSHNISTVKRQINWLNDNRGIYFTNVDDEAILWDSAVINYQTKAVILNGFHSVDFDDFTLQQYWLYPREMPRPNDTRLVLDQKPTDTFTNYKYVKKTKKPEKYPLTHFGYPEYFKDNNFYNDTVEYDTIDTDYIKKLDIKKDFEDYYHKYSAIKNTNPCNEIKLDNIAELAVKVADYEIMLDDFVSQLKLLTKRIDELERELNKEKTKKVNTPTKPTIIPRKIRTQ